MANTFEKGLALGLAMGGLSVGSGGITEIPIASKTTLGGIKLSDDFSITSDGVLSIPALQGVAAQLDEINGEVI